MTKSDLHKQHIKDDTSNKECKKLIPDAIDNLQETQHAVSLDKELIQMEISDYIDDTI